MPPTRLLFLCSKKKDEEAKKVEFFFGFAFLVIFYFWPFKVPFGDYLGAFWGLRSFFFLFFSGWCFHFLFFSNPFWKRRSQLTEHIFGKA